MKARIKEPKAIVPKWYLKRKQTNENATSNVLMVTKAINKFELAKQKKHAQTCKLTKTFYDYLRAVPTDCNNLSAKNSLVFFNNVYVKLTCKLVTNDG